MNKIEEFIKKNKGCPLTPAATKELLTKFMELMSEQDEEIDEKLTEKQDKLVSGTNIKTINGLDILGNGNISIKGWAKLYKHEIIAEESTYLKLIIVNNSPAPIKRISVNLLEESLVSKVTYGGNLLKQVLCYALTGTSLKMYYINTSGSVQNATADISVDVFNDIVTSLNDD